MPSSHRQDIHLHMTMEIGIDEVRLQAIMHNQINVILIWYMLLKY